VGVEQPVNGRNREHKLSTIRPEVMEPGVRVFCALVARILRRCCGGNQRSADDPQGREQYEDEHQED